MFLKPRFKARHWELSKNVLKVAVESPVIFNGNFMANSLCSAENVPLKCDLFFALRYMEWTAYSIWLCCCCQDLSPAVAHCFSVVFSCFPWCPSLLAISLLFFFFQILINPLSFSSRLWDIGVSTVMGRFHQYCLFDRSHIIMLKWSINTRKLCL